ncbi:MAG: SUMF1/EgtB/PvdO family nonheme iron enzyme [Myxococcales bacterium]
MRALGFALALLSTSLLVGCEVDAVCLDCEGEGGAGNTSGLGGGDDVFGNAGGVRDGGANGTDGAVGGAGGGLPPCFPSEAGERCNGVDDDCDGRIDEDFDLQSSLLHCGACDAACEAENAEAACEQGSCRITGCLDGFADLQGGADCEYRCPVFPTLDEACNGLDDDCDGEVDEDLPAPPTDLCRRTAGTPCVATEVVCDTREGRTTWFCDYPEGVEYDPVVPNGIAAQETRCDGVDGDCDGVVDDPWPELGQLCDDGGVGACGDGGEIVCDPDDDTRTTCDLSRPPDPLPGAGPDAPELCNGRDDNCDGIVDNSDPGDPDRVIDDLVHIDRDGLDFWIYRHEASRPDATESEAGVSSARSCSNPDVLPWTFVSFDGAAAACAAAGLRLCTAQEWQAACEGGLARDFPYDGSYDADACNGADHDAVAGGGIDDVAVPTGERTACESAEGLFDLSGNVKEWTDDVRGMSGGEDIVVVRGGSFQSPAPGLTCQTDLSQATASTALPSLGFRCCSDDAP